MKLPWIIAAVAVVGIIGAPVAAQAWTIDNFQADIQVKTDASINVAETIDVNFDVAKHGVYRYIPVEYKTTDNSTATIPISEVVVQQDGQPAKFSKSTSDGTIVLKIGSPNQTITGVHQYVISYTAEAVVNFFSDHDELYWNATGNNWEVPISKSTAVVHLPGSVSKDQVTVKCFTGAYGSTAQDCSAAAADNGATYSANDYLTVVTGFPTGIVTKPANYDRLRHPTIQDTIVGDHGRWWIYWLVFANVVWPLGVLVLLIWWWAAHGRDPGGKQTLIAQYDPPDNLRPALMRMVQTEKVTKEMIGATIVDLAVRGYLKITETVKPGVLGIGASKKYTLTKLKEFDRDTGLLEYEKLFLTAAFYGSEAGEVASEMMSGNIVGAIKKAVHNSGAVTATKARATVDIDDLKLSFYKTWKEMQDSMYQRVTADGYFLANPKNIRMKYLVIGAVVLGIGWPGTMIGWLGLPISGGMIMIFSQWLPKRSAKGVEAAWHAKGFKLFLETAEKYRLQWQEKENIFEQYLPYAMVFGVADKWSKALAELATKQPTWFEGQPGTVFNTMILYSALNSFNTVAMHTVVSPAASGGSGFGGGGFSGGGGGGGGGGSW